MPEKSRNARAALTKRVTVLLDGCLGALPYHPDALPSTMGPLIIGPYTGAIYGFLFCLSPWLFAGFLGRPEPHLFWLSVFGALYAFWATSIARYTSAAILEIIGSRIVPALSDATVRKIDDALARRFKQRRLLLVSWIVAAVGTAAAVAAILSDVPDAPIVQVAWWAVGWLFLFVTAAKATNVARFYQVFAVHLEQEQQIYVFDPARSTLVRDIAAVGQQVLIFWVGIAVSIAFLIPFSSLESYDFHQFDWHVFLSRHTVFELLVGSITSFFSLVFGTFVFLRTEGAIRGAVEHALDVTLRLVEREIAELFAQRDNLTEGQWRRMTEQASLHRHLTTAGSYRGFLISGLSLLLPLVGPALELLKHAL